MNLLKLGLKALQVLEHCSKAIVANFIGQFKKRKVIA